MRNKERERIIELATQIQALRENIGDLRQQLTDSERELDSLLKGAEPASAPTESEPLVDRIPRVLDGRGGEALTIDDLQELLLKESGEKVVIGSLRSTCARLAQNGRILRAGRGAYRSAKPNPSKLVANAPRAASVGAGAGAALDFSDFELNAEPQSA